MSDYIKTELLHLDFPHSLPATTHTQVVPPLITSIKQCLAVEKVERVSERVVPSATVRFFVITFRVSALFLVTGVVTHVIPGITKPAIRRLARRGGVKRISGLIYEETRGVLKIFLENVSRPRHYLLLSSSNTFIGYS